MAQIILYLTVFSSYTILSDQVLPERKKESEVAQSCLTLCDPMDCRLPGCSVRGILQARVMEWDCCFLLQGIFPTQGSNLGLWSPALAGGFFTTEPPGKALHGDPGAVRDLRCKERKDFQLSCWLCFCLC